jgi:hypothetical protein
MAKKPNITTIASGYYSRNALNNNFTSLQDQFDNTLSLDGSTPNAMLADLDMNSNDILNAGNIDTTSIRVAGQLLTTSTAVLAPDANAVNYTPTDSLVGPTPLTVESALNQITDKDTGSSVIGFTQAGAGAIDRTVEDRLRDRVSAADFGAVGDGVTDDTVALQAALDAAAGGVLFVPQGQYIVSETLYIPAGTAVCGEGKYSLWTNDAQGTEFITTGAGNAQRWTDIDGSDPADDTPLFVAQGDGVYLDSVALLTGEGVQPAWSMGVLFPCVKQCGFSRLVARGFTDGCVYLDATWSDRNTTLINLHPEITPSTGMNEFAGIDFYLQGGGTAGFGIKIQGTTRSGTSVPTANDWLWGFGGTSDIRFTEGRLGGTGINGGCFRHDVQLFGANAFGQGVTLHNVSFRLSGSGTYFLDLDRTNRLIVDSAYGETVGTEVPQISVTSRTQSSVDGIIRINDKLNGTVFLDGVSTGTSGSTVPWAATRCIVTHRVDGRLFTPSITGNFGSTNALFLRSFATNGQMRLTYDDGTTGTDFLRIQNDVIRPEVASSMNIGSGSFPFNQASLNRINMGGTGPRILFGSGSPEGAVSAPVGSIYLRSDGGAGTSFYVKESGTGNTGWVAK